MTSGSRLPRWPFMFDAEKAIEAILFVAPQLRQPTLHSIAKILYQADRLHLSRYGRPISGDRYIAMKHGPVPSRIYDILKTLRGDAQMTLPEGAERALTVENSYFLRPQREARLEVLSQSERECLMEAVRGRSSSSFGELTDESHDAAWQAAGGNDLIELEHFLLTLANAAELRAHFLHEDTVGDHDLEFLCEVISAESAQLSAPHPN